ncbi:MAG: transcription antitermination factor NusB [Endomicrobium sp.]|nr:transcription antitermination factor NusB [Endomicrobium sp.]
MKNSSRRKARECSLQMLYMFDNCDASLDVVCNTFNVNLPRVKIYRDFAMMLFLGVCHKRKVIDFFIREYAKNWELERMIVVDRNIIRIAIYEIMFNLHTPINVIINEAIEISKKYSTEYSSKFINGMLDKLKIIRPKVKTKMRSQIVA